MNEEQAFEKLYEICDWLEERAKSDGFDVAWGEPHIATTARDMCNQLLASSGANDAGGCPLCLS